jgi:hypothetical protein
MAGIGTLGKLFFRNFKQVEKGRLSSHYVTGSGLAGYVVSRRENNPAEMFATARRIRRASPAQNRRDGGSERLRPHLRTRA